MIRKVARYFRGLRSQLLLTVSAGLTIVGLALMVWSMLDPTPWPVLIAMSVGQAVGTLAFALYGFVVLRDLVRVRRTRRASMGGGA